MKTNNFKTFYEHLPPIKFPKTRKDISQRLDKISIFEYFNITEERKISNSNEFLVKEIVDYVHSEQFNREFKYTFSNEEKKYKFILLNIGLLANRIENSVKEDKLNFVKYIKNSIFNTSENDRSNFVNRMKLLFCFKYLPLKFHCKEVLRYHIGKNQIKKTYSKSYIIEDEFMKKFNKKDFLFLRLKRQFIEDLNKIEENEEKFKEKYIQIFLLNKGRGINDKSENKNNTANEIETEKLFLFFLAHKNYLSSLSFQELLDNKIYWGLHEDKSIESKH